MAPENETVRVEARLLRLLIGLYEFDLDSSDDEVISTNIMKQKWLLYCLLWLVDHDLEVDDVQE